MANQITTMWDLITQIKTTLLTYQNTTLSAIKLWKRGIISPPYFMPALALMPISEDYGNYGSGGEYRVVREINVEIYSKLLNRKDAVEQCQSLVSAVKDIVQSNIGWSDNAIDTPMPNESYEPLEEFQLGILNLKCRSREIFPAVTQVNTVAEVSSSTLIDTVYDTIVAYKTSGSPSLSEIKTFYRSYQVPVTGLPSICIFEDILIRDRRWAGVDNPNRAFRVVIFTPLLDKENNLSLNIEIMEKVKDIIQINYKWGGKAWNTLISRVSYDQIRETSFPLYATTIYFNVNCIEIL
jgi:hypothetical protein